ncbi:MAG: cytochrome c family protein [Pseudomonadota bacterium]
MFDTMTLTKILGAFCGSLLVFLLGKWVGESLYHGGGHGGDHAQAYVIDTGQPDEVVTDDQFEEDFTVLLAAADPGRGERVFSKCRACHKLEDGARSTGPHLYGVVGRDIGGVDGFGYSGALASSDDAWTPENLNGFLENPRNWAPGTKMVFSGLPKVEDRANLIAYLGTIGN